MAQRFGNLTLGEINDMLISFIGKDMYLSFWEKENPKESIYAYNKHLNRLLKEDENSDLSALCLADDRSIAKFVFKKILPYLHDEYSLFDKHCIFMKDFVYGLYDRFIQNKWPISDYCSNFDSSFQIQDYLEQAQQKYKSAFDNIAVKYGSLKKFREHLNDQNIINEDYAKNIINAIEVHGKNPTWCNLEKILNQVKEDREITALLIDAYVMINIYNSLHDKVETNVIIGIQYDATISINNGIQYFFADHGYKKDESRAECILKTIEKKSPEAAKFYCNWFRGYLFVAKGELKQAKKFYKEAFLARRFAGCQFELFIKQAFTLSCYLDFNADKVRDSADNNSKSKSPLSNDAKKFWNYGYAASIFEQKAENTHLIAINRFRNFLKYFRLEMFYGNTIQIFISNLFGYNIIIMPNENESFLEYEKLSRLSEKDINKRVKFIGTNSTKNPPITVALFYVEGCYSLGYNVLAEKFIGLVRDWLDKFDNLNFSLCSDKGSSIVCDAIQQYKNLKLHHLDLDLTELKRIVLRFIDKSNEDSLTHASLQKKRCALQEAIESCDMDIVKAVVEKIKGIDNLRISADEESPVYYAISRYVCLYRYINDPNFKIQEGAIYYKNLDFPGLTKEDNNQYIMAIKSDLESDLELAEAVFRLVIEQLYGLEELWRTELVDIQNICLYLIEKTKDQDGYCKKTPDGNFVTSLLFAAESNNIEICRKLIIHKADPNIYSPTFLKRCMRRGSCDLIAMYWNEFPEQAKISINDTENIFQCHK